MSLVSVRVTRDTVTPLLQRQVRQLQQLPRGAYATWQANTPVRSGNARRRTRLTGDTIRANYGYAVPLDSGTSRQAPAGMFAPTLTWVQQQIRKIFRG